MKIKRTKKTTKFCFSGSLENEIKKAKVEYEKKKDAQERVFLSWQFQKAKKAYETYERRLKDLNDFIRLAEEELKAEKQEGSGTNAFD